MKDMYLKDIYISFRSYVKFLFHLHFSFGNITMVCFFWGWVAFWGKEKAGGESLPWNLYEKYFVFYGSLMLLSAVFAQVY